MLTLYIVSLSLCISHFLVIAWFETVQNAEFYCTFHLVRRYCLYPSVIKFLNVLLQYALQNSCYSSFYAGITSLFRQYYTPSSQSALWVIYSLCVSLFTTAFFLTPLNQYKNFSRILKTIIKQFLSWKELKMAHPMSYAKFYSCRKT